MEVITTELHSQTEVTIINTTTFKTLQSHFMNKASHLTADDCMTECYINEA